MSATAPSVTQTAIDVSLAAVFVSLELSRSTWLATSLAPGNSERMSKRSVGSGDVAGLLDHVAKLRAKAQARTGKTFPVIAIHEAGLDGFWLRRVLEREGIECHVVDAASVLTSRRRRKAKTDRIDGVALLRTLLAYKRGEPRVCAMVRPPSPEEEDRRRLCRELDRLELTLQQLRVVEAERDALLEPEGDAAPAPVAALAGLRGIGPEFAAVLWLECFFRSFGNRRQVAAYAGLAPTPWQSGSVQHEQGLSKSGNPRLRTMMVQLAWLWLRHQPTSALSVWFRERVKRAGGRRKKTAIVALARKLLVALWRLVSDGVIIKGAVMKA